MRTIIAGSRSLGRKEVDAAMQACLFEPSVVLSGHAHGVDLAGEDWAREHGIPIEIYPADWNKYGRAAGFVRNELMATKAEALVAVWDGRSHGTLNMIQRARVNGLAVEIWTPGEEVKDTPDAPKL